jgi:hypothetical protein
METDIKEYKYDHLFIIGYDDIANEQLRLDFDYIKLERKIEDEMKDIIKKYIKIANDTLPNLKYKEIIPVKEGNKLTADGFTVIDNVNLSKVNVSYAYCVILRYLYIFSGTYNLAVNYKQRKDCCIEGFASAINRYFDFFCSAFYDIEKIFGSQGSFFSLVKYPKKIIYLNPPFDLSVMNYMTKKVIDDLSKQSELTFHIVVPYWKDAEFVELLLENKYLVESEIHIKGDVPFIDYHSNSSRVIYPCDILYVILSNKK